MKHVAMQHCHIPQWHDGLSFPGQQGCCSGRLHMENNTIQLLASLLDADRRCTTRELAAEIGVCHKTVLHILHDILDYRKLAACWIPHEISQVKQWHRYAVAQALLDRYQRESGDFLGRIIAMDKTGLAHTNQTSNANQMNVRIPVLLVQRKCAYTMFCEGDVHCDI